MARRSKSAKRGKPKAGRKQAAPPTMPPLDSTPLRWMWACALVMAVAIVGVYWNTLGNEFLTFDDRKYIYKNELVTGDGGLAAIWGDLWNEKPKLHYRPLTFTVFWIEHQLVKLEPPDTGGEKFVNLPAHPLYHWTQILFHAANAILVLFVLRALRIPFLASVLVAVFFAIHPVNVASVAWMAELKNVLSGVLFWLALLLYIHHRRSGSGPWLYLAAVAAFALALLAKVAVIILAPVLIVTDRLLDRRWSWGAVVRSSSFFALGLVAARLTAIVDSPIREG